MTVHSCDIDTDEDGWVWATCACGWQEGPFVSAEDGIDAYGDHCSLAEIIHGEVGG